MWAGSEVVKNVPGPTPICCLQPVTPVSGEGGEEGREGGVGNRWLEGRKGGRERQLDMYATVHSIYHIFVIIPAKALCTLLSHITHPFLPPSLPPSLLPYPASSYTS